MERRTNLTVSFLIVDVEWRAEQINFAVRPKTLSVHIGVVVIHNNHTRRRLVVKFLTMKVKLCKPLKILTS